MFVYFSVQIKQTFRTPPLHLHWEVMRLASNPSVYRRCIFCPIATSSTISGEFWRACACLNASLDVMDGSICDSNKHEDWRWHLFLKLPHFRVMEECKQQLQITSGGCEPRGNYLTSCPQWQCEDVNRVNTGHLSTLPSSWIWTQVDNGG